MENYSDYIIYVDESGDHGLDVIDSSYPIFVLTFCIFHKKHYVGTIVPMVQDLKFRWFGHDAIVLHEREIRKQTPPFKFLQNRSTRDKFLNELTEIIDSINITIISSVIHKHDHKSAYSSPANPYEIAMKFCIERTFMFLKDKKEESALTHCIFERRGVAEDNKLELEFRRICDGANYHGQKITCIDILFVDKKANSSGLQIADLTARPIGQHVMRPDQANRAYSIIERKLRRSPTGKIDGWGLKVFP